MCVAYKFDKIVTVDDGSSMDGCEVDSKLFFACGVHYGIQGQLHQQEAAQVHCSQSP